ncbi:uncharacterized protein F5Z01DRAFT_312220 [Emericellopsis atlantica]|uniref:ML-like domain-containing protein n=1 Tax=Emericellopsis atlantica TaxID=2614577 RepID=A0A9P7ZUJ9_9HYPO|nr:uncharacterized protein F5Z01DRAFT_312220 [Emericellopsis atlantica]KAG9257975.1 hypothetical protein F5Z01DRAFT_312220 [Emericellopsis atlantica]
MVQQHQRPRWTLWKAVTATSLFATGVLGDNILSTSGFTNCVSNSSIEVDRVNIRYNNGNKTVIFDVAGNNPKEQNVSAALEVKAYGQTIYEKSFNPCDKDTFVQKLCPVPEGPFSAWGEQVIPSQFADMVPDIAFQIPDIAAQATLKLKSEDTDEDVACIQSQVTNGKTADVPAVPYVAAGIAGIALAMSGVSAVTGVMASAGAPPGSSAGGTGTTSPGFTEIGWFQGIAMNGMMSVNYPPVYRSFTKNFAFSTGLIAYEPFLRQIDSFRAATGGNLTTDSVEFLSNATLIFTDGTPNTADQTSNKVKRAFDAFTYLTRRQFNFDLPEGEQPAQDGSDLQKTVSGLQAWANQLRVPESDVFMTILLIAAIVITAIIVFVLLFKLILELWALWGTFPQNLTGFRKHYWGSIARTITSLIFVLYGIWVLYCVFQFTRGDSWAATTLAGVTLAIFTTVLLFFSWKIWSTARALKKTDGNAFALYESKTIWVKYSLFYDAYRKQYWWLFLPLIVYMAVKGCVLAAADGSGRAQTIAVLTVETVMLALLLWSRPFERKSGNVVNIMIQVTRVLSVACILVFVEEFGFRQTTQTVTGVVLIAVQSTLTVVLVVLIAWHAFEACCQENPHRKRRKEMEKLQNTMDDLTPLDARNSLLMGGSHHGKSISLSSIRKPNSLDHPAVRAETPSDYAGGNTFLPPIAPSGGPLYRPMTPTRATDLAASQIYGNRPQPTLPDVELGAAQAYGAPYRYEGQYRGGDNAYGRY